MQGQGINEAEMQAAQQKISAERRRIRHFTYEKELGEDWVGRLVESDETPPLDQTDRVFLILGYRDRMLVVRADGESQFLIPAVGVAAAARDTPARGGPGAQLGRWLKPVCRGQWGIHLTEWTQHTRFEKEATEENSTAAAGSMRYDLFLYGTAAKLEDLPEGSAWSRRAITRRDFIQLIRAGYTEFEETVRAVHETYVVERERAAAAPRGSPVRSREWGTPLHQRRVSRRSVLGAAARAGVGAIGLALVGCAGNPTGNPDGTPAVGAAESPAWFKDTAPFIVHADGKSLEARLENMRGLITPQRFFFVRNNSFSLDVDAAGWRLSIDGDALERPRELSYADVLNLPSRTLVSYLECGGNQRAMFDIVQGRAAGGTQWGTGGVSNGVWTGVSLWDCLAQSGVREDAVSVLLIGLDTESPEQGFRRVLPIEKARHPDTLLAYALNGEVLPRDHGYPLRALVPGWVGSSSIKWLSRIVVSSEPLWTRNNTTSYVLIGDDYPPEGEALGRVATAQSIKSALALPWPAKLEAGSQRIHGYAQSPDGPITRVEWSDDAGETWRDAAVLDPQPQYSWARFEFTWNARRGEHVIMTRATDSAGTSQPGDVPFNKKGYLFNRPLPHPIRAG